MKRLAFVLALLAVPALAQQPYDPPDAELWRQMKEAFGAISMPLPAHQQVQQIMQSVEQQSRMKAAQEKARAEAAKKADEAKPQ